MKWLYNKQFTVTRTRLSIFLGEIVQMVKSIVHSAFILAMLACLIRLTFTMPASDEEQYADKEYTRELLNWLNSAVPYIPQQQLCKYPYYYGNILTAPLPKRNSELINSLLSLPKNMNDAGK